MLKHIPLAQILQDDQPEAFSRSLILYLFKIFSLQFLRIHSYKFIIHSTRVQQHEPIHTAKMQQNDSIQFKEQTKHSYKVQTYAIKVSNKLSDIVSFCIHSCISLSTKIKLQLCETGNYIQIWSGQHQKMLEQIPISSNPDNNTWNQQSLANTYQAKIHQISKTLMRFNTH